MKKQITNFWHDLPKPFSVLAPMDGVTDAVFRQIIVKAGKPDVLFTEFTNCDGLLSKGQKIVMQRLEYKPNEHPIVAQIWGINPESFLKSAKLVAEMGFDGIDINMGCPHHTITKNGACSGLITNQSLAKEIIQATKEGGEGLPVSVKTRIGKKENEIHSWIKFLLEQQLPALTVHLRTVSELSSVPAHWELMSEIVSLRNAISSNTSIIGNGDVQTLQDGEEKAKKYKIEGVMYGRAIFSDAYLFDKIRDKSLITPKEKLSLFLDHIRLFKKERGSGKYFAILKKYCKIYVSGIAHASEIREKVMRTNTIDEMEKVVENIYQSS